MKKELWVDRVKLLACVLVVLGHFFQSMEAAGLLSQTGAFVWFDRTIYYFHVPLFFLCSGYLYEKTACVASFSQWKQNGIKKLVTLGVPYVTFSFITWLLKRVFEGQVNSPGGGLLEMLFLRPASPYWYLYSLFLIFLLIPTFVSRKAAICALGAAAACKIIGGFWGTLEVFALKSLLTNGFWFVLGMVIQVWNLPRRVQSPKWRNLGFLAAGVFLAMSVFTDESPLLSFFMGILGCAAVFLVMVNMAGRASLWDRLCRYTLPVFLMHTIFAAGMRSVLMKFGITSLPVHIVFGLLAAFAGPMIAMEMMKKLKLDGLIYPQKYMKLHEWREKAWQKS